MKDVAKMVGVSMQTISAVINNKPGITEETRARVLDAIRQLGYRPYPIARSLRTGQTRTFALLVSDIANPSFATMASAAEDYARQFGYNLIVYNTHDDPEREASYVRMVTHRWVDGALFVCTEDHMTSLDAFREAAIPFVAIDRIPERYSGPSVTLDNVKAGQLAARHLLELNHRCIAHISGPRTLRLARERLAGFQAAMVANNLDPECCASGEGRWTCDSGYQAMLHILDAGTRPTALFAANDRMAIGAMNALYQKGLRVPEDVSVVGMDDIEVAAYQIPPLTTIRQSFAELATHAVQLLLQMVEGQIPDLMQIVHEPELMVRQSTAPAQ